MLPQGFRDSPHIFGQTLASDLQKLHFPQSTLLQYVNDLLLCSPSLTVSQTDTTSLLNFLADRGYRVSPQKVQLSLTQVTYLGVLLAHDSKAITLDRKCFIRSLPIPKTKQEILSFLGLAGYFRTWIPNYSLLAKPLYDLSRGTPSEPVEATVKQPFLSLQQALLKAPALHLPDLQQPFILYVHEHNGLALGVLGQMHGPTFAAVAYLSKQF